MFPFPLYTQLILSKIPFYMDMGYLIKKNLTIKNLVDITSLGVKILPKIKDNRPL